MLCSIDKATTGIFLQTGETMTSLRLTAFVVHLDVIVKQPNRETDRYTHRQTGRDRGREGVCVAQLTRPWCLD